MFETQGRLKNFVVLTGKFSVIQYNHQNYCLGVPKSLLTLRLSLVSDPVKDSVHALVCKI